MTHPLWIFCADIGSVKAGRFGWFGVGLDGRSLPGSSIEKLASAVAEKITSGAKVALGFECPLYVPLRDDPMFLTKARTGEGNRSWSAGAGCGALATGLVEVTWLLEQIRANTPKSATAFLDWKAFEASDGGLFLWEALCLAARKAADTLTTQRLRFGRFKLLYQTQNARTRSRNKACSRSLARAWYGLAGLRMSNIFQSRVLSSRHNPAVAPVRFALWTLRDKAAQRLRPSR
jgi:hypothetical protein